MKRLTPFLLLGLLIFSIPGFAADPCDQCGNDEQCRWAYQCDVDPRFHSIWTVKPSERLSRSDALSGIHQYLRTDEVCYRRDARNAHLELRIFLLSIDSGYWMRHYDTRRPEKSNDPIEWFEIERECLEYHGFHPDLTICTRFGKEISRASYKLAPCALE